ncbi:hypothetical protein MJ588_17405 [Klebsiella pneumoniae]|nr:hypothetical protein MJ588_17405 [Klebsiella pneumoniae]
MANYGLERGLNDDNRAAGYDEVKAYTPAWAWRRYHWRLPRAYHPYRP